MKKHIPNFLTCMNLVIGALGCISIVRGDLWNAIYFVLLAGVFDFLDGLAARMLHVKSEIGKQLDSLADMVSFGLLPALYLQGTLSHIPLSPLTLSYIGIMVAPFSALRLAKFNIDERQSDHFIGLPTPANAIMITSLTFLPFQLNGWGLIAFTCVSCFLLVSPLSMLSLKFVSFGVRENILRYLLVVVSLSLVVIFGIKGIVYVIPFYILLSIVGNFVSKNTV